LENGGVQPPRQSRNLPKANTFSLRSEIIIKTKDNSSGKFSSTFFKRLTKTFSYCNQKFPPQRKFTLIIHYSSAACGGFIIHYSFK